LFLYHGEFVGLENEMGIRSRSVGKKVASVKNEKKLRVKFRIRSPKNPYDNDTPKSMIYSEV
jgi:hypothetical protein